jgi:uncharacterized protein
MKPLRILLLSDGRPGHYHLAEGVCAALRRLRPVEVVTVDVQRRKRGPTRLLMRLLNAGLSSPAIVLRLGYGLGRAELPAADIIISAGGDTIAANAAGARLLGAANIFCGTLRHAAPLDFSLIISSYARHERLARHIVCLKPTAMDPDALGRPKDIPAFGPAHPPRLAALLIGGDSGLFRYSREEWHSLLAFVTAQHAAHGTRWLISTSRRTPEWVADAIGQIRGEGKGAIAELLDYRKAGPGTLPRLMARADAVLCTEDSSTMVSETIAARLPVVGVAPLHHSFKSEEADYRSLMIERRWARFMPLVQLTPESFLAALSEVTPLAGNHLDSLARMLAERLPEIAGPGVRPMDQSPSSS